MSFRRLKPTKTNLIRLSKKLSFVKRGENFLSYKQEQLIQQIKRNWPDYKKSQSRFYVLYIKSLLELNKTYKEMGVRQVSLICNMSKIQFNPIIDIKYIKNIGILLPDIYYDLKQEKQLPPYSFVDTSPHLDKLIILLKEFFESLIFYAEKEDILLKLLFNFKKISRRLNGLKNIIIPQLFSDIKTIKDILEELDRENFVRLKKTKSLIKQ
ncbi:MAG: V-type ATP synthase subunit D [Promethearchaeota archaeon]